MRSGPLIRRLSSVVLTDREKIASVSFASLAMTAWRVLPFQRRAPRPQPVSGIWCIDAMYHARQRESLCARLPHTKQSTCERQPLPKSSSERGSIAGAAEAETLSGKTGWFSRLSTEIYSTQKRGVLSIGSPGVIAAVGLPEAALTPARQADRFASSSPRSFGQAQKRTADRSPAVRRRSAGRSCR